MKTSAMECDVVVFVFFDVRMVVVLEVVSHDGNYCCSSFSIHFRPGVVQYLDPP